MQHATRSLLDCFSKCCVYFIEFGYVIMCKSQDSPGILLSSPARILLMIQIQRGYRTIRQPSSSLHGLQNSGCRSVPKKRTERCFTDCLRDLWDNTILTLKHWYTRLAVFVNSGYILVFYLYCQWTLFWWVISVLLSNYETQLSLALLHLRIYMTGGDDVNWSVGNM